MNKRKVLILPSWFPNDRSPLNGVFVEEQARMTAGIYDVAVLYGRWVGYAGLLRLRLGPRWHWEVREGIPVLERRVIVPFPRSLESAYDWYLKGIRRGFCELLETWGRPEIIHAHVVLPAGWAAVKVGREFNIPVVLTEHSGPFSMHLRSKGQRSRVREALSGADRVIAVSPSLASELRSMGGNLQVEVVGNLVRTDEFYALEEERQVPQRMKFLSVALLGRKKGMHLLIEALHLLVRNGFYDVEVLIAGDGPERYRLEKLARTKGVSDRCSFLGILSRPEVRERMQGCDVLVLPSMGETFGTVLTEAMACGKPVIATACGGPEFIVTPGTGLLVEKGSADALARAMASFASGEVTFDSRLVRESVVERFGEGAFLSKIKGIYEGLLKKDV